MEGDESAMFKKIRKFLYEVKVELKKVSWPSRREISGSTGVVIMTVIIVSAYLGLNDLALGNVMAAFVKGVWGWNGIDNLVVFSWVAMIVGLIVFYRRKA